MNASSRLVTLLELLELKAEPFWRLSSIIGQMLVRLETGLPPLSQTAGSFGELQRQAESLGLRSCVAQLERIKDVFVGEGREPNMVRLREKLHPLVTDLHLRMVDELREQVFLWMPPGSKNYYAPQAPLFGVDVNVNFPSASFEVDEAGKCFALGRYTASVFHLMRVMECGIRATARCLSIPDPLKPAERNWGIILREIKAGIDAKWPTQANRQSGDGALFESLYVSLDAVRNPWRNATMHVENKYTKEEAEHVFGAVRAFMAKLSSRMDEQGQPLA